MKKSFLLGIDRFLAGKFWKQLSIAIIPFILVLLIIAFFYTFHFNRPNTGPYYENIHKAFVDMTNPETVSSKLDDPANGFWSVFGFAIVYFLGAAAFTGLLIATITNIWRARADKFRRGTVKYKFKDHIVFIGYNSLIAGMIQKICEKEDVRIVVGVENGASTISDKIKNRIFNDYRDRVVVLQADGCNMNDLERLRVSYAKAIYIIGEHDDAYNLKCYRTIYEVYLCEKSPKAEMPQCYVNLHSQATLTLFRTYASSGELGIDFAKFHSFSFFDEWARKMIQSKWKISENFQDHFIIAGMTEMGIALARKIALLCHNPNGKRPTKITLIDDDAVKKSKLFIIQHQAFFNHCGNTVSTMANEILFQSKGDKSLDILFEFIEGNLADDAIRKEISRCMTDNKTKKTIALCYDDPQQNLIMGLNLPDDINKNRNNTFVWVYQPTLGDLGKYLKNSRYQNVITFGMLGEDLDIQNEENTRRAKLINHYFLHFDDENTDYSNKFLINTEWENTEISVRWACIRHAEFLPLLLQYNNSSVAGSTKEIPTNIVEAKLVFTDSLLFPIYETQRFQKRRNKYIIALEQNKVENILSTFKNKNIW